MIASVNFTLNDENSFYILKQQKVVKQKSLGDMQEPPKNHEYKEFTMDFTMEAKEDALLFLKVQSNEYVNIPLEIWQKGIFIHKQKVEMRLWWGAFGYHCIFLGI